MRGAASSGHEAYARLLRYLRKHESAFERTCGFDAFYAGLAPVESARVGRLWIAVEHLDGGDDGTAALEAEALVRSMPDEEDEHGAGAVRTFAEALLARVQKQSSGGGNLYLTARPPGAQLRAFELLRLRTPLIPFGYAAANRALLAVLDRGEPVDVTLIDIGIGRAGQIRTLLKNPSARAIFRSLHVIGVDPDSSAATSSGALELAEQTVLDAARSVGIAATFHPIGKLAEELTVHEIHGALPRGVFVASCTFALHHVVSPGAMSLAGRDAVLRTLRAAGVSSLVLVEPDSNHFEDDLARRFLFAYRHYRSVADLLHRQLAPADAFLVWNEFFAPEVRNVIAHDGVRRVERHEELGRWAERCTAAGFAIDELRDLLPQSAAPEGFAVRYDGPFCKLCYNDVSVLGVLRASTTA